MAGRRPEHHRSNFYADIRTQVRIIERDYSGYVQTHMVWKRTGGQVDYPCLECTFTYAQQHTDRPNRITVREPWDSRRWASLEAQLFSMLCRLPEAIERSVEDAGRFTDLFPGWGPAKK